MRRIFVLLLAGSLLTGSKLWADDAGALIEAQKALTAAQAALTSTENALRLCQSELTKTQKALTTTEAALTTSQAALKIAVDDANKCREELNTKVAELESTKKALNLVVLERADLAGKLKRSEEKRIRAEKTLKAISEELKKYQLPEESKKATTGVEKKTSQETPAEKSIVFHNRASFFCERGMAVALGGRPPVLIYPDMTIKFNSEGEYTVTFAVESPRTDVTLNLDLAVPFLAPVGSIRPCNELRLVEGSSVFEGGQQLALYEARVTVPPIRIRANQGDKTSQTTQYTEKIQASGNSAGLALAYGCSKTAETIHIPVSTHPQGTNFLYPRRSGTATVGTIVN